MDGLVAGVDAMEVDGPEEFPSGGPTTVDFDWFADGAGSGGRQKKQQRLVKQRTKPGTFGGMGLTSALYKNITYGCKFKLPTPIQRRCIPIVLQGLDVVGMARTGSGKTAAFLIPILQRLKGHSTTVGARCLVLSPSRELALQTYAVHTKLSKGLGFRTAVIVGGDSMSDQFMQLAANPDILLATPGRLMHVLNEVKDFSLRSIEMVVFDEADRLFEMGFASQIGAIAQSLPSDRQTMMFSATMPKILAEFAKSGLQDPEVIRLDAVDVLSPDLTVHHLTVRHEDKAAGLLYLLKDVIGTKSPTIVFCATKHHVAFLHHLLNLENIKSAFVYGAMDQSARKIQVAKFRNGIVDVLLVTDVAARGVDLPSIENVIHHDFPPTSKLFVHRSGRTARAGRPGTVYSLITRQDLPYLLDLHLFLSEPIAPASEEPIPSAVYGHLPQHELSLLSDGIRRRICDSEELMGLLKAAENGFKLYLKTRPSASNASVRRIKDLPEESIHPLFLTSGAQGIIQREMECQNFGRRLKAFRPSASVFECRIAHNRAKNTTSSNQSIPLEPTPELRLGAFRDVACYISHEPADKHQEAGFSVHSKMDAAVMDLMGEDQEGLMQQRRQYHWDRRHKRYVQLPEGESSRHGKRIKMENGKKMKGKGDEGRIYDGWMKSHKTKIQTIGSVEDVKLTKRAAGALETVGKRFKRTQEVPKGEDALNLDQVKKRKKLKAHQRWKNMPKDKRKKTKRPPGISKFKRAK